MAIITGSVALLFCAMLTLALWLFFSKLSPSVVDTDYKIASAKSTLKGIKGSIRELKHTTGWRLRPVMIKIN